MKRALWACVAALAWLVVPVSAEDSPRVRESFRSIWVTSTAPIPEEVRRESEAKELAQTAAVQSGHTALLNHVLQKKTRSRKTLAEAEIPYLELQDAVRAYVRSGKIKHVEWRDNTCRVTIVLPKAPLKKILKNN